MNTYKEILAMKHKNILDSWGLTLTQAILNGEITKFPFGLLVEKDYWLESEEELKLCLNDKDWIITDIIVEDNSPVVVVKVMPTWEVKFL